MDAMNIVVGAVLFIIVLVVIVTNNKRFSDLKKTVQNASVESAPVTPANGMLVKTKDNRAVPQRVYYVHLFEVTDDHVAIEFDKLRNADGRALAADILGGRCKIVYRPDKRILFKIDQYRIGTGTGSDFTSVSSSTPTELSETGGVLYLKLEANSNPGPTKKIFETTDKENWFTVFGVPAEMSGNTVSGV